MKLTFDQLTKEINSLDGITVTNLEMVQFHYFNPNGIVAKWQSYCDEISNAVAFNEVPSGWILAHGTFNDFHYNNLYKLINHKKPRLTNIKFAIDGLEDEIVKGQKALANVRNGKSNV